MNIPSDNLSSTDTSGINSTDKLLFYIDNSLSLSGIPFDYSTPITPIVSSKIGDNMIGVLSTQTVPDISSLSFSVSGDLLPFSQTIQWTPTALPMGYTLANQAIKQPSLSSIPIKIDKTSQEWISNNRKTATTIFSLNSSMILENSSIINPIVQSRQRVNQPTM